LPQFPRLRFGSRSRCFRRRRRGPTKSG
jgi:hypothetical protein